MSDVPAEPVKPRWNTEGLTFRRLDALLPEWERHATALYEAKQAGRPIGPVTGLPKVDQAMGGALPQGLSIIHGQTGAGKTALLLQFAANCRCPALFVSCEMSEQELLRRTAARVTGTYLNRFKTGELHPKESVALAKRAIAACPQLAILDASRGYAEAGYIQECALATKGDAPHLLVIVDSVHSWVDAGSEDAEEYAALNKGLSALRKMAASLECTMLATAERNRANMGGGVKKGLNAGAGSRKLEYGAEMVLDLGTNPEDKPDMNGEVPVTLLFAKNRHGAGGTKVELRFKGAEQKFREAF